MGSRRVGWAGGGGGSPPPEPETATPTPAASVVALTLEELLNLLLDVFSFFLFCYTQKTNREKEGYRDQKWSKRKKKKKLSNKIMLKRLGGNRGEG